MDRLYIPVITLHLSIVAKKHSIATISQLRSLELLTAKNSCTAYVNTICINWHMIFGLEQEGGSLIAPMALAHPLHPIDNRSRNRRRNMRVGWCVSYWWPLFPSRNSVLRRLVSWINRLPPACWSTFWKSIFKHQLGCRIDILDSISSFFCILTYAIIYVLIHHIILATLQKCRAG